MMPAQMKPAQHTESAVGHGRGVDMHCELGGGCTRCVESPRRAGCSDRAGAEAGAAAEAACATWTAPTLASSARADTKSCAMQNNEVHATRGIRRRHSSMARRIGFGKTRSG